MKRIAILLLLLCFSSSLLFAKSTGKATASDVLKSDGMGFGIGVAMGFKSPLFAAGSDGKFSYNEVFAVKLKAFNIDDCIFGLPFQFEWMWTKKSGFGLGIKLDLDTFYLLTGNYSQLTQEIKNRIEALGGGAQANTEDYDVEHGFRVDLTPKFAIQYKFFQLSFGAGLTMNMNANQTAKGVGSLKSGDKAEIDKSLVRIGLNPTEYTQVVDKESFNQTLNNWQKIAYYGLELDTHFKISTDFLLGKHVVLGADFLIRFHSEMGKWDNSKEAKENFATVFSPEKFEGTLGFHFIWMF